MIKSSNRGFSGMDPVIYLNLSYTHPETPDEALSVSSDLSDSSQRMTSTLI